MTVYGFIKMVMMSISIGVLILIGIWVLMLIVGTIKAIIIGRKEDDDQ